MPPASRPRLLVSALGVLVLVGIGGASLARYLRMAGAAAPQAPVAAVRVAPVVRETFAGRIEALGTARAEEAAALSQARMDRATAQRDSAAARVAEVEARMSDRLIRAPFAGVIGLRMVSPGVLVSPGDAITTLDDVDPIKLDFSVPELLLSALHPGLELRAHSEAWPERRAWCACARS